MSEVKIGEKSIDWMKQLTGHLSAVECASDGKKVPLAAAFDAFAALYAEIRSRGKAVWWVGNGGSSGICSHLSQDTLNKLLVRSFVLTDPALSTCMANDYGYENVYARPLDILSNEGDLLIAISSSGKSKNILSAVQVAAKKKMKVVTLSGFEPNNPLRSTSSNLSFYVPSHLYGQVEIGHETILHAVIEVMSLNK